MQMHVDNARSYRMALQGPVLTMMLDGHEAAGIVN